MTTDHDFDRLARAWLELGPDEAPERTVDAILQATDAMPQVRRRLRWPAWRDSTMSRSPLFIGVWAMVLVAVAGFAMLNRPDRNDNAGTPTSPPSSIASGPPASTNPAAAALDPRLVGQWMGDRRPLSEMDLWSGTRLVFTEFGAAYLTPAAKPVDPFLYSAASTTGTSLRLETGSNRIGCPEGSTGTYTLSISPSGRRLHVDGVTDSDCVARLASMPGDWWRIGCQNADDGCLGDLDAGTYRSAFTKFHPQPPDQVPVDYGNLTYTVPDGWANAADWDAGFELTPSTDFDGGGGPQAPYRAIDVLVNPAVASQDGRCSPKDQPGVAKTVASMMQAIVGLPSLTAEHLAPIMIDGRQGQMVDLGLSPSWTGTCARGSDVIAPVIRHAGSDQSGWQWLLSEGNRWRLILLDLGDGTVAAIVISDSAGQARFDELVDQAMPIVQSMQFR